MEHPCAVRARGLTKRFGDVVALDGVDLDVPTGQVHGLVGPNGAGKTTLMGLLLGLTTADHGRLEVLDAPVGRTPALDDGVSGFVDGPGLYPTLTARQNLTALQSLQGRVDRGEAHEALHEALEQVGLAEVANERVGGFSLGMRQRLGLAAALLSRPRLLVLDEPANGLDPAGKRDVHRVLLSLVARGATVVLSSHRMDDLAALCSEVTLLTAGKVVFSGPVGRLAAERGDLDHRLVTSDRAAARRVAAEVPGLRVLPGDGLGALGGAVDPDAVTVRGGGAALDELVVRLVGAGVSLRELAPTVPPLESAFLALTGAATATHGEEVR